MDIVHHCMRLIFPSMQHVPIVDIAFSLDFVPLLEDERKMRRYISRLQETIEVSNHQILKQVYDQEALLTILCFFKRHGMGNLMFKEKIASYLQTMVNNKSWLELGSSQNVADMLSCLREIDPIKYGTLLKKMIEETDRLFKNKMCTSRNLVRIYLSLMRTYERSQLGA